MPGQTPRMRASAQLGLPLLGSSSEKAETRRPGPGQPPAPAVAHASWSGRRAVRRSERTDFLVAPPLFFPTCHVLGPSSRWVWCARAIGRSPRDPTNEVRWLPRAAEWALTAATPDAREPRGLPPLGSATTRGEAPARPPPAGMAAGTGARPRSRTKRAVDEETPGGPRSLPPTPGGGAGGAWLGAGGRERPRGGGAARPRRGAGGRARGPRWRWALRRAPRVGLPEGEQG